MNDPILSGTGPDCGEAGMSAPEDWLRHIRDCIRTNPPLPPGTAVMRSGIDQVISISETTRIHARTVVSGLLAEDARSLIESADYVVRYREAGPVIICECCGTPVAQMPERPAADRDARWKPAIWEPGAGRRHTLRRCEWKRANP